jgi:lauroyl/myristoyl acyltransferase
MVNAKSTSPPLLKHPDTRSISLEPEAKKGGYAAFYTTRLYEFFLGVERVCGHHALPLLTLPFAFFEFWRRRRDYANFRRIHTAMPSGFWKGHRPLHHYWRMIYNWRETLTLCTLYTRMSDANWQKRFTVKGTPPQDLPDWGKRPVILAFMHTGYFGFIRWFMRTQGVPTASLIGAMPVLVDNPDYNRYLELGDELNGVEGVPHYFRGAAGIREALRYLKPGRAMTMALDGGAVSPHEQWSKAGDLPIDIKRGTCRVGAQVGAIVVPTSVRRKGYCRYEVHFGKPVPDQLLEDGDYAAATQHVVSELWPDLEAHPMDLNWTSMEAFHPELAAPRIEWP